MLKRLVCTLAVLIPQAVLAAPAPEFVWVAPMNQTMPLAQFQNDKLTGGILKDMGDIIARRLGRVARYASVPGDQVSAVMKLGKVDGICYVRPFWIDGNFNWSEPFMPDAEVVAARLDAPSVSSLANLRDIPVGTVLSHRHPRIEQVLGERFHRVDSESMSENLRRINQNDFQYTVVGQSTLDYQMSIKAVKLRTDIIVASFNAQCAFTKTKRIPFASVDHLIKEMLIDGTVDRILARYR
jgi:polar amino acid transport system substrate-binding protein